MDIIAQIALNAVIAGAIYSLVALGFNLIYSTARFSISATARSRRSAATRFSISTR